MPTTGDPGDLGGDLPRFATNMTSKGVEMMIIHFPLNNVLVFWFRDPGNTL